jgi:hypothetical protein
MNISSALLLVSEGLELDHLMAYAGASEDHVSGLRAEGVLAVLEQTIYAGCDDSREYVEG